MNPDGSGLRPLIRAQRGTSNEQPDWAPDGGRLLFNRCSDGALCRVMVVDADGTGLRRVTPRCSRRPGTRRVPRGCEDADFGAFTPDGERILYTRSTGRVRFFPRLDTDQIEHSAIAVVSLDGTGRGRCCGCHGSRATSSRPRCRRTAGSSHSSA